MSKQSETGITSNQNKTKQINTKAWAFWLFFFFACSNVGAFNTPSASHTTVLFYYKVDQNRQINQIRTVSALCLHAISSTYLSYVQTKIQLSCNSFQADKYFWSCATQCFRPEGCCKQGSFTTLLKTLYIKFSHVKHPSKGIPVTV